MSPDIATALAQARRALADLERAVAEGQASENGAPPAAPLRDDEWPLLPDDPDLVTTAIAAQRAGRSPDTMRTWARERGIGKTYGGRYFISLRRLKKEMIES